MYENSGIGPCWFISYAVALELCAASVHFFYVKHIPFCTFAFFIYLGRLRNIAQQGTRYLKDTRSSQEFEECKIKIPTQVGRQKGLGRGLERIISFALHENLSSNNCTGQVPGSYVLMHVVLWGWMTKYFTILNFKTTICKRFFSHLHRVMKSWRMKNSNRWNFVSFWRTSKVSYIFA